MHKKPDCNVAWQIWAWQDNKSLPKRSLYTNTSTSYYLNLLIIMREPKMWTIL